MNFYIHIPFCRQKCPYCKFALTPIFDALKKQRYIEYLKKEICTYLEQYPASEVDTIYFGGGTPSVLTNAEIESILCCFFINHTFQTGINDGGKLKYGLVGKNILWKNLEKIPEISFECNPEDITTDYIRGILDLGINRLSIGVQSLNDETLEAIHRSNKESIFHALDSIHSIIARKNSEIIHDQEKEYTKYSLPLGGQKFSLNIDFILGLPHSKPGETLKHVQELHTRFPYIAHTSVYMLESGAYPKSWKKLSIDESKMEQEYNDICTYFDSIGWNHYEISNWARPGYECKHNQGYWNHTNTRGFGLSATSYEDQRRWTNSTSFLGYYKGERKEQEEISKESMELEGLIYSIRTFRLKETDISHSMLESLEKRGYIYIKNGKIKLTPTGIFRENTIIAELMNELPP